MGETQTFTFPMDIDWEIEAHRNATGRTKCQLRYAKV